MDKYKKGRKKNLKKDKFYGNRRNRKKRKKNRNKYRKNYNKRVNRNEKNIKDKSIGYRDLDKGEIRQIINQITCTTEFFNIAFHTSIEMLEGIIQSDGMIRRFRHRMKEDPAFVAFLRRLLKKILETNRETECEGREEVEESNEEEDPEEQKVVRVRYDHYYT